MASNAKPANSHLYWARNKSEDKALTGEHKALSAEEAAAIAQQNANGAGSSWNKASTWEEKNLTKWAASLMSEEILPALKYTVSPLPALPDVSSSEGLTPSSSCSARVKSVENVKGDCTYVLSRGKEKVLFELTLKVKLEMELLDESGALKQILTGTLNLADVSNDELSDAKMPSAKFTCDQAGWKGFFEQCAKLSWPSIKEALETMVAETKEKWRK